MATRTQKPNGFDLSQMHPIRRTSFSSDIMSNSTKSAGTSHTVPRASPPPAYIAQTEASDLITTELDRKVLVSESALTLLNEFLDHVLYSIISISRSVSLGQLKAAVPAVLKPRLGKAALRAAEEELKEYMEDEEEEELYSNRDSTQPRIDFDADLVWKLARLRCMVYARMGDLEEEDEEDWLEKEHLLEQAVALPVNARQSMAVTPGSAIFLTSVIEYLGEQALYYAAQHAQKRHDNARILDAATPDPESSFDARHSNIVLEGKDMNHVGRDSPLSRLWRSWRRNTRSPVDAFSRPMSPDQSLSPGIDSLHSRTTSNSIHHPIQAILEEHRPGSAVQTFDPGTPSQIPLPMSERDVEEIEGYADVKDADDIDNVSKRPISMPIIPGNFPETPAQEMLDFQERSPLRPKFYRIRSSSMPIVSTPFGSTAPADGSSIVLPIQNRLAENEVGVPRSLQSPYEGTNTAALNQSASLESTTSVKHTRPQVPSRSATTQSSEQLNTTVGVLAGALGAVGVHHAGNDMKPVDFDNTQAMARKQSTPSDQVLTSASIKRSGDFDVMYVPEGRLSPDEQRQKLNPEVDAQDNNIRQEDSRDDPVAMQYENHRRYSQQAHEMETPSIYNHREHSPRFPSDMRSSASQAERPDNAVRSYVSTEKPETLYYSGSTYPKVMPPVAEANVRQVSYSDSPVSPINTKRSNNTPTAATMPTPEVPKAHDHQQSSVDQMYGARSRGHSKSSSSSSRLLGFTRDADGRPQTIYQQKAAGDMSDEARRAHSSTPNGGNMSRPETANSASSMRQQNLRQHADSDDDVVRAGTSDTVPNRSLEVLIKSDETLHYTLTPATATFRESDVDSSPIRTQTQDLADFFRGTSPPSQENATPRTNRSQKVSVEGARAPQILPHHTAQSQIPLSNIAGLQQRPASKSKNSVGEARDAKVPRSTGIRDLTDFVRTTGPSNDDQLPKAITGGAATAHQQAIARSPAAAPRPENRLKFQARDARPSRTAESSALIDFIREGPPREQGDHRINRHIAPFRTTMDSDDLNALASSLPKNSSDTNGNTTLNSNVSLLNHASKAATSPPPQTQLILEPQSSTHEKVTNDDEDRMPKRTRRRIKDPYAIDDSDDDTMEEPAPKQTQEESLVDFLKNTAPPPNMTAQPILASTKSAKPLSRTPSVDKLKEFVRNRGNTPIPDRQEQLKAQSRARAESPHLTQSGSKIDSYRPTQPTHAKHVDRDRASKVVNRTESRAESRTERRTSAKGVGATADLADYLRNTGPPPTSEDKPEPFIFSNKQSNGVHKQEGGLKKFFSRRGRVQ